MKAGLFIATLFLLLPLGVWGQGDAPRSREEKAEHYGVEFQESKPRHVRRIHGRPDRIQRIEQPMGHAMLREPRMCVPLMGNALIYHYGNMEGREVHFYFAKQKGRRLYKITEAKIEE